MLGQHVQGGRNSSFLHLFGGAHHAHEFLMPAGKGHHQLPYHISLPNHSCFQEGISGAPCCRQERGEGRGVFPSPPSQALRTWGAREPLRVHIPTHGILCHAFRDRLPGLLGQGKERAKHLSWRARLYRWSIKLRWKNQLAASLSFKEVRVGVVGRFCTLVSVPPAFPVWLRENLRARNSPILRLGASPRPRGQPLLGWRGN